MFAFSGFKREVQAMAKQHRGRVRVLQHGKKIKQTRIKEGRWSESCFLVLFFVVFFFKVQKVKVILKDPSPWFLGLGFRFLARQSFVRGNA